MPSNLFQVLPSSTWARAAGSLAMVLGLAACSGGGSGGDAAPPAASPLQALRELRLLSGSLEAGGCSAEDGAGTAARLSTPGPLALDTLGNVTVLGDFFGRLRHVSPQGVVTSSDPYYGGAPEAVGNAYQFFNALPVAAYGPDNSLYLAAWRELRPADPAAPPTGWVIFKQGAEGQKTLYADPDRQAVRLQVGQQVSAMAFDSQGRLLVADTQACAVRRVEADHAVTTAVAATGLPGCTAINALAVDAGDDLAYALSDGSVRHRSAQGVERTVKGVSTGARVSLAFDTRGRLIISDRDGKRLLAEAPDGTVSVLAANASGPERPLTLSEPAGVAADRSGQIFLADARNCTINRFDADGRMTVMAGMAPQNGFRDGQGAAARLGANFRLAVDARGVAYVSDPGNRVVRRIDATGTTSTFAGTPETSRYDEGPPRARSATDLLWDPGSLAVLPDGRLLVVETSDQGFLSIGPTGTIGLEPLDHVAMAVEQMAVSPSGNVYTSAGTPGGCSRPCTQPRPSVFAIWQRTAGKPPTKLLDQDSDPVLRAGAALISVPKGLAAAADGNLYFSLGHAVFRRDADGRIGLVAGGGDAGYQNGARDVARFSSPSGLALDPGAPGVVFVADTANHLVRKISAEGEVSRVLGTPGVATNQPGPAPAALRYPREVQVVPGGLLVSSESAVLLAIE